MMRLSRYILLLTAFLGMAVGCVREEMAQIDPDMVIVPVLHDPGFPKEPEAITITAANQSEEITFTWDAAHLGFGAQFNYSVELYTSDSLKVAVGGGVNTTTATVKYEDINYALVVTLGAVPAEPVKVNFCLSASVGVRKFYSEPVPVIIVPTNAAKQFPNLHFIGSFCDWNHLQAQLLYDFDETGVKYQAVIDFGEEWMTSTFQGFKLTPEANWNSEWSEPEAWDEEYQDKVAAGTLEKNLPEVEFATAGGNCMRYSEMNRFYHFTMNTESGMLTMEAAFDEAAVVFDGKEIGLDFHSPKHAQYFYADVTVTADSKFKVVLKGEKNLEFGADAAGTEGLLTLADGEAVNEVSVAVEPGNYRLYVNMNNWGAVTYEFDMEKYGTEEGSGASVEVYKGWGICGYMNNWKGDVPMEYDGECWWVAKNVYLEYDYDFIFRKDGASAIVFKGGGFEIDKPTWQVRDGSDIIIAKSGTYDIYLNPTNGCCWFMTPGKTPTSGKSPLRPEGASDWSLCGSFNEWGSEGTLADVWMYTVAVQMDEKTVQFYKAEKVALEAGDQFKVRYLYGWNDNRGAELLTGPGYYCDIQKDGGNITAETAGDYDIYVSTDLKTMYILEHGGDILTAEYKVVEYAPWAVTGDFNGWGDRLMIERDGFYVASGVSMTAGSYFSFKTRGSWDGQKAAVFTLGPDMYYTVSDGGYNINSVVAKTGNYDIYLSTDLTKMYFMTAGTDISEAEEGVNVPVEGGGDSGATDPDAVPWSIVGSFTSNWDISKSILMTLEDGYFVATGVDVPDNAEFKFCYERNWDNEVRSAKCEVAANTRYDVGNHKGDKENTIIPTGGTYDFYLSEDATHFYLMEAGKKPGEN